MPSSTPPKVVFDTNIYISAIIFGGAPNICLELVRQKKIELFISRAILLELAKVLQNKFKWSEGEISDLVIGIGGIATMVKPDQKITKITADPSDNMILEAALVAQADYIISGDKKHILPLKSFENIAIVSAVDFLRITSI